MAWHRQSSGVQHDPGTFRDRGDWRRGVDRLRSFAASLFEVSHPVSDRWAASATAPSKIFGQRQDFPPLAYFFSDGSSGMLMTKPANRGVFGASENIFVWQLTQLDRRGMGAARR